MERDSLSPIGDMRYSKDILDDVRARIHVSDVVGRTVKLQKRGREHVGLSPFKQEKTPSFTVNDQKGFYHCFATGEHGDIFTFLMKVEGLSFTEAVERMAEQAGVTLPKPTARDAAQEDHRTRLMAACEAATAFFQTCLHESDAPDAVAARDYVAGRKLSREAVSAFRLGYSPKDRQAMRSALHRAGFTDAELAGAGLIISGEDISVPYDRFRGRLIFPIADLRGQPIAFGGRILDQSHPAKYLNSPETPLFQKGRVLYNAHIARKAAHDSGAVIVGEGYMDVIALWEAGHHHAVAPLGTALTPGQLELLWRMADEPTLCLDGDTAGRKAAERAADTALELLEPGRSLQFSFLPDGLDPDDLLRSQGPQAVTALLGHTMPLADLLWEKAWQRRDKSTPERRAAARGTLLDACETIKHPVVRAEYVRTMKDRIWNDGRERGGSTGGSSLARTTQPAGRQFAPGGGQHHRTKRQNGPRTGTPPPAPHTSELLASSVIGSGPSELDMLERQLMQFLAAHFQLMDDLLDTVADLELADSEANALRSRLLNEQSASVGVDIYLRAHDLEDGQDQGSPTSTCAPTEATPAQPLNGATPPADITEQIWRQLFSQYTAATLRRDIQQALDDFEASSDPSLLDEIARLQLALAAVTNEMHAADGTDVT